MRRTERLKEETRETFRTLCRSGGRRCLRGGGRRSEVGGDCLALEDPLPCPLPVLGEREEIFYAIRTGGGTYELFTRPEGSVLLFRSQGWASSPRFQSAA